MQQLDDFTVLMEAKWLINQHKGGTDRLTSLELVKLMKAEVRELEEAIKSGDFKNASLECADIANYCMFISDKLINRRLT